MKIIVKCLCRLFIVIAALASARWIWAQTVSIVDILPYSYSGERNHDSEPWLVINPKNVAEMYATSLTPDIQGGSAAPVFHSLDGGQTWEALPLIPGGTMWEGTRDLSGGAGGSSGSPYFAFDRADAQHHYNLVRYDQLPSAGTVLLRDMMSTDQPRALLPVGNSQSELDHILVGLNYLDASTKGKTASADIGYAGAFKRVGLDVRGTGSAQQDAPPVAISASHDGTTYAAFYNWTNKTVSASQSRYSFKVVVTLDSLWGLGSANPFRELVDSTDHQAGQIVATGSIAYWATLGSQRLIGSDLALAADPSDQSRVFIAWCDGPSASNPYMLHIRHSTTRGVSWSTSDDLQISNAKCPALAISDDSQVVGLLYQKYVAGKWETHFSSSQGGAWNDMLLCSTPDLESSDGMYTGEYSCLRAIGSDFVGVFSTNNDDSAGNWTYEPTFQRNMDVTTRKMLDLSGSPVDSSVDPFFFRVHFGN